MRGWLDGLSRRLLLLTVWVAATVLAGAVAWSAVAGLGQQNTGASVALTQSQVRRALAQQTSPTLPAPTTSPTQPARSGGTTSTPPTSPPGTSVGAGPTNQPPPSSPSPRKSRFWTLDGVSVGVACQGDAIQLLYAYPQFGWAIGPRELGASEVSVPYSHGSSEFEFRAACVAGIPTSQGGQGYGGGDGSGSGDGSGGDHGD